MQVNACTCTCINHFAAKCHAPKKTNIKVVDEEDDEEVDVSTDSLDKEQLVTLKLESGNYIRFQADTGAQCNVIPVSGYKKATKDLSL